MGHNRLDFILGSYSISGINFSPIIRQKLPAQVSHFSLDLFWLFWDTSAYTGGRKMNDEKIWKGKRGLFKYLKKR